jgi:hypothetical protein
VPATIGDAAAAVKAVNNPLTPTHTAHPLVDKPVIQAVPALIIGVHIAVVPQTKALLTKFVAVTQFVAITIGVFTDVVPQVTGEVTQVPALEIPVAHKLFE